MEMPRNVMHMYTAGMLLLALGCSATHADNQAPPPPPQVSAATVATRTLRDWADFTGRLEAPGMVEVRPRISGFIDSVHFTDGSSVREGQLLFQIDPRPLREQVRRLDAELRRARSELTLVRANRGRGERLMSQGAIPHQELERLTAAEDEAAAAVDSITASLAAARLELEFAQVRAPIAGRASRALITPGNLVSSASVLTTLSSDGAVHAYFDIDERTYLANKRSARHAAEGGGSPEPSAAAPTRGSVQLALADEADFTHRGRLDFLDNRLDPATGTIRARAVFDNPDGELTPGLFARLRLFSDGSGSALLVDDKAVLTDQDRSYVYVLDAENRAQRRDVELGRMFEGLRVVQSGLAPDERVIVHGVQKVFAPGMQVAPRMIDMGESAPTLAAADPLQRQAP